MNDSRPTLDAINLSGIGKKFNGRWIFRKLDLTINKGDRLAITGSNGSGKSTLLQIISGFVTPAEGTITWHNHKGVIAADNVFHHIAFASPYLELIENFTLEENVRFFERMKDFLPGMNSDSVISLTGIEKFRNEMLSGFSSGMRQRVKLALAFSAQSDLLLLDEPLSNLDKNGFAWFDQLVQTMVNERTLIVCSNMVKEEMAHCTRTINVESFS
jgi:ABC-type multidrug transport system ATPase subunit